MTTVASKPQHSSLTNIRSVEFCVWPIEHEVLKFNLTFIKRPHIGETEDKFGVYFQQALISVGKYRF